jgi:hypothetical protein
MPEKAMIHSPDGLSEHLEWVTKFTRGPCCESCCGRKMSRRKEEANLAQGR